MAVMQAVTSRYWVKAAAASVGAFLVGAVVYVLIGIVMAEGAAGTAKAAGGQQVTVQAQLDDIVTKFAPEEPLVESERAEDYYITYNSRISLAIGVVGTGHVEVVDQDSDVLHEFDKETSGYEDFVVPVDLEEGLKVYELSVKLDGANALGPNAHNPIYIDYKALPLPPTTPGAPGVPDTGGVPHIFLAGYAVPTYGMVFAGVLFGGMALGIFMLVAVRRRRREVAVVQGRAAAGRRMRREISSAKIAKTFGGRRGK